MSHVVTQRFITGSFTAIPLLLAACSGGADESQDSTEPIGTVASSVGATTEQGRCEVVNAGDGWINTFMPQSVGTFSIGSSNYPGTPSSLDTVVGLSNGPADAFSDLGPIVRFNPNGNMDARDGDQYVGAFPYTTGEGAFEFRMDVSIPTHTYTVWVRHLDSPFKPFELLGENLRFRTQQSNVTRLDNIGRFTDSAEGHLQTCISPYTAPDACTTSASGAWSSRGFPARGGQLRIELIATTTSGSIDAVIGASKGTPTGFSSLAPIVRFRTDGTFDARNGAAYSRVNAVPYVANQPYKIALDIDIASRTYSAMVRDGNKPIYDSPYVTVAQGYAFRSEQAQVTSLDRVGQFVDGTPGSLSVCNLTVAY